jgi:hypothetical protein
MSPEQHEEIFMGLDSILEISKEFLPQLRRRVEGWTWNSTIADLFFQSMVSPPASRGFFLLLDLNLLKFYPPKFLVPRTPKFLYFLVNTITFLSNIREQPFYWVDFIFGVCGSNARF